MGVFMNGFPGVMEELYQSCEEINEDMA